MPVIQVTSGPMSNENKKKMIERMVEVSMEITGAPELAHNVIINDLPVDSLSWGKKTVREIMEDMSAKKETESN